jgi:hypothetical protein
MDAVCITSEVEDAEVEFHRVASVFAFSPTLPDTISTGRSLAPSFSCNTPLTIPGSFVLQTTLPLFESRAASAPYSVSAKINLVR